MVLNIVIDIVVVVLLIATASAKGFERTLPLAAFLLMLFPVESQIPLPGFFDLTTQRLIVVVLVGLYFAMGRTQNHSGQKEKLPFGNLLICLIVWMFLSSAVSVVPDVSVKATLSQGLDFVVPYYIFAKTVSKVETVNKILFAFVAAMFVCSIFAYLEIYWDWSILSVFPKAQHHFSAAFDSGDRGVRAQATFPVPILFGAALAMAIPMALHLLTVFKAKGERLFLWSAIMLMFLGIYKSGSRGPWMALALSLAILLVLRRDAVRKYLVIILVLTATVLIVRPGVWDTLANLYHETQDPDSAQGASYEWRYALYRVAKRELSKDFGRALWGYGPESFYYLGLKTEFFLEGRVRTVPVETCDSAVVEVVMDTGCVGLLLVAVFLTKAASAAFRNFRKLPRPANALFVVFFANICAFCFMMTNVQIWAWGQQNYLLWIVVALLMVYPGLEREGEVHQPRVELTPVMIEAPVF